MVTSNVAVPGTAEVGGVPGGKTGGNTATCGIGGVVLVILG